MITCAIQIAYEYHGYISKIGEKSLDLRESLFVHIKDGQR